MKNKNESGSIMLEVIALLTIIAIITPLIVRQQIQRNIEISNINIAGEMRILKNAVQNYIHAQCPSGYAACTLTGKLSDLVKYGADGFSSKTLEDYQITWCDAVIGETGSCAGSAITTTTDATAAFDSPIAEEGKKEKRRFAIIELINAPTFHWGKKRARRIASLIGVDAGICSTTKKITGVDSVWEYSVEGSICAAAGDVAIHTGLME